MACAVDAEAPPPPELSIAWQCKRWGTLPSAGGYFDQDYGLVHTMSVLSNIFDVVTRLRNLKGAQIHSLSSGERRVIKWVLDQGISING